MPVNKLKLNQAKAPVVLNSDGTVSSITGTAQSIGTADTAVSASVFVLLEMLLFCFYESMIVIV